MRLSVVVTIVEGGPTLERCLTALATQVDPPTMEILVAWDDSVPGMKDLGRRHPDCRFIPMGPVATDRPADSHAGQHELFDRRRARGLTDARGDLIAILEDRGLPRPDWAATVDRLHRTRQASVIGGAVVCGDPRLKNRAVCLCDFGRYQPPLEEGPANYLTDINISYKRPALESVREHWQERYHETIVHWALVERGETLLLAPSMQVEQQRGELQLGDLLSERFHWGRLFAYTRIRDGGVAQRLPWFAASPLLPIVLFGRIKLQQLQKGTFGAFLPAAPLVALLVLVWSLGEAWGYLTGRP